MYAVGKHTKLDEIIIGRGKDPIDLGFTTTDPMISGETTRAGYSRILFRNPDTNQTELLMQIADGAAGINAMISLEITAKERHPE